METVREVGNSLRWTRVSWRWEGVGLVSDLEASGVREMDHASPLRKRMLDAAATEVGALDAMTEWKVVCSVICFPDSRIDGRFVSSHWVSQAWAAKAWLATIPLRTSRLVLTPSM